VIEFKVKSVVDVISSSFVSNCVVVANPVVEMTPSVISIFVPAVNSQDISSPSMVIIAPVVNLFCNPVVEMTPSVMSIFVPAVKLQDTSSPPMVIFAHAVNPFCFPCMASSTSPIIGSVNAVFTSTEPLTIKLLLRVPPIFVNTGRLIRLNQQPNHCSDLLN
jgi:hypothetical protein